MNTNELVKRWKAEEEIAHIHGWDFSHIEGRYMEEGDLPWDYRRRSCDTSSRKCGFWILTPVEGSSCCR